MIRKFFCFLLLIFLCFDVAKAENIYDKINNLSTKIDDLEKIILDIDEYPIGSIYITTSNTNPSSILGGEWEVYGSGRKLVGVGTNKKTGTVYNFDDKDGSISKSLSLVNMPSHSHTLTPKGNVSNSFSGIRVTTSSSGAHSHVSQVKLAGNYGLSTYSGYGCSHNINKFFVSGGSLSSTSVHLSSHSHTMTSSGTVSSTFSGSSVNSSYTGNGTNFSVQNPYVIVYIWKKIG